MGGGSQKMMKLIGGWDCQKLSKKGWYNPFKAPQEFGHLPGNAYFA